MKNLNLFRIWARIAVPLLFVIFASTSVLAAEGPVETTETRVLVMKLRAIGVDEGILPSLISDIAQNISNQEGYSASTMDDIGEVLAAEKTKAAMGCEDDVACMAAISNQLNAEWVLGGSLGKIGKSFVLNLTLTNANEAVPGAKESETVETIEQLREVLPALLGRLFSWEGSAAKARFKMPEGEKLSFAILDLKPTGVSEEIAKNLTQILSAEVKRIEGTSVIGRDDLIAMVELDKEKSLLGCNDDSCIAELGGALGVDKLIVGNVGKLAESFVITLRLLNARRATVDSRITESFKGEEDQLIRAVRHASRKLLGIETEHQGKIVVTASQEEAVVHIDNEGRGTLPIPPIDELQPGRHSVRISKNGFFDWQGDFYVEPNETTVVWSQLKERPAKWYQKWWVWTAVGTVAVGAITAALIFGGSKPPPEGEIQPGDLDVDVQPVFIHW